MECKKNNKNVSLAFKAVAIKRKLEEEVKILKNENGQNQPAKLDIKH